MLLQFYRFLTKKLRLSNPWNYKVPLLISFPYFLVFNGNLSHETFFYSIIAAFTTCIGFLGIGYLNNDLSDREQDKRAEKNNALFGKSNLQITLLYFTFALLAFLPWRFLPFDEVSILLIGVELLLFILYSFQPFRLKERGIWGLITDSLYAHVLPAILASWTFYLLIDKAYPYFSWFILSLGIWQFVSGFRNILSHQIKDYKNDLNSNTKTWVNKIGLERASTILKKIALPLEFLFFLGFLAVIQFSYIFILAFTLLYWIYAYRLYQRKKEEAEESPAKHISNLFLDDFYTKVLPYLILFAIIFIRTEVRYVLLLHGILFFKPIGSKLSFWIEKLNHMVQNSKPIAKLYSFTNYYRGLVLHLFILLLYSASFCGLYFLLDYFIQDQERFLFWQKMLSRGLVVLIIIHAYSFFFFRSEQSKAELKSFFWAKSSAINLAIFRIIAFYLVLQSFDNEIFKSFEKWSHLPESAKVGLPFIGWLIELIPINPELYHQMSQIGYVLAICGFLGLGSRWTLKLYIPIALYLWGVPCFFGKLNHHHIMVWVPIILAFSPCSDTLSIDALIRRIRKKKAKSTNHYGLAFSFIWITLGGIYCLSGIHKLWDTGLFWALSDNLKNQIQLEWVENYDVVTAFRIDHYPLLLKLSGLFVILFEICYPLFLIRPATRIINFAGSWMLHLTAGYFLNIDFSFLRKMHFSLVDWNKGLNFLKGKFSKFNSSSTSIGETLIPNKLPSLFFVGGILVGFNLLFGILGISSWPFSAYPAYAGIIPDQVSLIQMKAQNCAGEPIDVKQIGQNTGFRWENIRPFEERIAESVERKEREKIQEKLDAYWDLWRTKVPELKEVSQVEMTLIRRPIEPEKKDMILDKKFLGTVNLEHICRSE